MCARPVLTCAVLAPLVLLSAVCRADGTVTVQSGDDRRALALLFFREGRRMLELDRCTEAVQSFEESKRLEPRPGTMLNLGYCYERLGKTIRAWFEYRSAAGAARAEHRTDREQEATAQAERLEGEAADVIIEVAGDERALDGFEVDVDGVRVPRDDVGARLPVGSGRHELSAKANGRRTWTHTFDVAPGAETSRVDVPQLETVPEPPTATASPPTTGAGLRTTTRPTRLSRTIALAMGAGGAAAISAGVGLIVWAKAAANAAQGTLAQGRAANVCVASQCLQPVAQRVDQTQDDARLALRVGLAASAIGAAALAGAGVLWSTQPARGVTVEVGAAAGADAWAVSVEAAW